MIQLILNGVVLPETSRDRYACYPSELSSSVDMISGRRVREVRGNVQTITWSYDYMDQALKDQLLAILRSGAPIEVAYLPDNGTELVSGTFWADSVMPPTFAFSKKLTPYWHNFAFTLREVKPHD